ncbi:GFA family protein [Sphingopyxis sp. YF1]|uniref:GFA family protein n=1 Tax=Sphingopyxis sp. YF1 TaxID=2482763 RepID=UPI001F61CDEC|nr:GFA family protein [Sphingopyxis sp. YF1]UNU44236.1 GFA family protein [Sphingopyxis sp. YF1]
MTGTTGGSCLCGGIRFAIDGTIGPAGQCHCSKCRKVSGTDGNAVFYAPAAAFRWLAGEERIRRFAVPDGGGWAAHFCGRCGSPVPLPAGDGKFFFVPAGLLDDDPGFRGYAAHIFVGSKAPWVCITDSAPQYEAGFDSARIDSA